MLAEAKTAATVINFSFSILARTMNDTLGGMLRQYESVMTPHQCAQNQISYNNSKWRILVRCRGVVSYQDARALLAALVTNMEPYLNQKHIHFQSTSIFSMLSNNRILVNRVYIGDTSMELYECTRSSPNFLKSCVEVQGQFQRTEWSEWKQVVGM